jgi:hypothetical protein
MEFTYDVTEIALSHLDTQWGFTDSTPVKAGVYLLAQEY